MSRLRVYTRPEPSTLSRAMYRVADALERHAPASVEVVRDVRLADLQVLHVIGAGADERWVKCESGEFVAIQYCLDGASSASGANVACRRDAYSPLWDRARAVWSYYDLAESLNGTPFLLAPLGVDPPFADTVHDETMRDEEVGPRDIGVMTSGYVTGSGAEAIEEVTLAAQRVGLTQRHLGPREVQGMTRRPEGWHAVTGIGDMGLAQLYRRTAWVSGLRHLEGFELPVIEGAVCGARPIVFDRPDMRRWYDGLARFVPESSGEALVEALVALFEKGPEPLSLEERREVARRFAWGPIVEKFWEVVTG